MSDDRRQDWEPMVSVLVPAYNMAAYLGAAIDSALGQGYDNVEVIVVDDGSTDGTRDVVSSYGDRVRYRYQANGGVASALNTALSLATGEFVRLLAADDELLPHSIEPQLALFRRHARLGLVFGRALRMDAGGSDLPGSVTPMRRRGDAYLESRDAFLWLLRGCHIACGSVLMRRAAIDRAGPFQQASVPGEDWDMFLRVAAFYDLAYIDRPLARYRVHDQSLTASFNVERVRVSHEHTLRDLYRRSDLPYRDSEALAYAYNERTLAMLAAYSGRPRTFAACLSRALSGKPEIALEQETLGALVAGARSLLPAPLQASLHSLRGRLNDRRTAGSRTLQPRRKLHLP